jgi:ATP-dependent RNA helicase DDX5/DBP2
MQNGQFRNNGQNNGGFRGGQRDDRNGFRRPENGDGLKQLNWSNMQPFKKNFYIPNERSTSRSPEDVQKYLDTHSITIQGSEVPRPNMDFEEGGYPEYILKEIRRQGYVTPTAIQAQGLPIAMSGRDMVGIAKTGSGKTMAYIVPSLIHIENQPKNRNDDGPIALVLAPTRELAQQIKEVAQDFGTHINVKNACLFGGASKGQQMRELERGAEIVIATPGRLIDFLERGVVNLRRCSFLVLDEADRMLDMVS